MAKRLTFVKCSKCGATDKPAKHPHNTGTATIMRCEDCATPESPYATMCRNCCITGHGTHGEHNILDELGKTPNTQTHKG